jgi:hypothetical protein
VTIDRQPAPPVSVTLAPGQDDGRFADDFVVHNLRPTFRVTLAPSAGLGDTIELYSHYEYAGNAYYRIGTAVLSATDISRGWVDIRASKNLTPGIYSGISVHQGIFARSLDTAGNVSDLSTVTGNLHWMSVVNPATVSPAPSMSFTAFDDLGFSSTDRVTSKGTGWTVSGYTGSNNVLVNIYAGTRLLGTVEPSTVRGLTWSFT